MGIIFNQVDWSEVIQAVGGRKTFSTRNEISLKWWYIPTLNKCSNKKNTKKDIKIELDKDADTESRSNNSKEDVGDGLRHFEDKAFLVNNESKYRSEDCIDNETDKKKDSDDEGQLDNDSEVIDDRVVV